MLQWDRCYLLGILSVTCLNCPAVLRIVLWERCYLIGILSVTCRNCPAVLRIVLWERCYLLGILSVTCRNCPAVLRIVLWERCYLVGILGVTCINCPAVLRIVLWERCYLLGVFGVACPPLNIVKVFHKCCIRSSTWKKVAAAVDRYALFESQTYVSYSHPHVCDSHLHMWFTFPCVCFKCLCMSITSPWALWRGSYCTPRVIHIPLCVFQIHMHVNNISTCAVER